jgi:hypothetical protein
LAFLGSSKILSAKKFHPSSSFSSNMVVPILVLSYLICLSAALASLIRTFLSWNFYPFSDLREVVESFLFLKDKDACLLVWSSSIIIHESDLFQYLLLVEI